MFSAFSWINYRSYRSYTKKILTHTDTHRIYLFGFTFELKLKEKRGIKKEGKFCTGRKKTPTPNYIQLLMSANYALGISHAMLIFQFNGLLKQVALNLNQGSCASLSH